MPSKLGGPENILKSQRDILSNQSSYSPNAEPLARAETNRVGRRESVSIMHWGSRFSLTLPKELTVVNDDLKWFPLVAYDPNPTIAKLTQLNK